MLLVTETSELHRRATLINQALLVSAVEQQEIVEVTKASADQLSSSIVQKEQELDRTKEELRSLASQLLQAQEDERRRIARELNDSFSQQLAYLGIQMFHLKQKVSSDAGHMLVAKIQSQLEGLANEVRALSHQLHPPALEHLGLVTSLRALLDDFESNHSIAINLLAHELTAPIPLQTATTLYRIVQESLWNVVKHFCMQPNSVLAPPITQLETSVRQQSSSLASSPSAFIVLLLTSNIQVQNRTDWSAAMNLAARKSDVKNHLSRRVVRHLISPDPIGLPSETSATEEPLTGNDPSNHLPSVDLGDRIPRMASTLKAQIPSRTGD
jgi:uncharacterized coiled-coil protein SlyX